MLKPINLFPLLLVCAAVTGCSGGSDPATDSNVTASAAPPSGVDTTPDSNAPGATPLNNGGSAPFDGALVATNDQFAVQLDQDATFSVSSNDTFAAGQAVFEVVQYPTSGEIVMETDGTFFYQSNSDTPGIDSFTYEVRQGGSKQSAKALINLLPASSSSSAGFTQIKPSRDSKQFYVSSSEGSDSNSCESAAEPCASLQAAFEKMRAGEPDHVYLKRGDVWRDQALDGIKSGRNAEEPAVLAFYGESGPRPKLEHSDDFINTSNADKVIKNVHIIGLHFDAYRLAAEHPEFTGKKDDIASLLFLMNNENILIEDNVFNHIEVVVQSFEGRAPLNFTLRRNIWTGAYVDTSSVSQGKRPSNIYAAGVDGLTIEENVFDYGGWHPEAKGAAGNMYNHNLYLQASNNGERVILRNNIITRASSHGVQLRAGGLAEDNFFGRNAIGLKMGYGETPLKTGVRAHAIGNVITEGVTMIKGDNPCDGENLCTPARWGIHFELNGDADWRAENNIVHSLDERDNSWQQEFGGLVTRAYQGIEDPSVKASNNVQSAWGEEVLDGVTESSGALRTLGDYYAELVSTGAIAQQHAGDDDFDRFMTLVKSRELQQWDDKLTAKAVNDYIRAGL